MRWASAAPLRGTLDHPALNVGALGLPGALLCWAPELGSSVHIAHVSAAHSLSARGGGRCHKCVRPEKKQGSSAVQTRGDATRGDLRSQSHRPLSGGDSKRHEGTQERSEDQVLPRSMYLLVQVSKLTHTK